MEPHHQSPEAAIVNVRRAAFGGVAAMIATVVALLAAEAGLRIAEHYPLLMFHFQLRPLTTAAAEAEHTASSVKTLEAAPGVDRAWYSTTPERIARPQPDSAIREHLPAYSSQGLPALYQWNRDYLESLACDRPEVYKEIYGSHKDLFVFTPMNPGMYPTFRFLRNASYPTGLVTNDFGWRGPGAPLNKPDRTIRIVFVGSSTTVGVHSMVFSYPEYIGVWLNVWAQARKLDVRFEVFNAAREGINSSSIAEVVRQEVVPLEPDLVVYYEGSNQFWPASFIDWPGGKIPERPLRDPRTPWALEGYSLLAVRAHTMYEAVKGMGMEPPKPPQPVHWPVELNEFDPPLSSPLMPVNLDVIVPDLEKMRTALAESEGDLVLSTFAWLVWDGMKLDPVLNAGIYAYLNETFWPFTYAHMRRMADFQNRVFAKYAKTKDVDLIDFAGVFPRDPALFSDAIHFAPEATRLQAWVILQQLIPLIEHRLTSGALPRPNRIPLAKHPAFSEDPREILPIGAIGTHCGK